jgi:hypothetical protein
MERQKSIFTNPGFRDVCRVIGKPGRNGQEGVCEALQEDFYDEISTMIIIIQ